MFYEILDSKYQWPKLVIAARFIALDLCQDEGNQPGAHQRNHVVLVVSLFGDSRCPFMHARETLKDENYRATRVFQETHMGEICWLLW